MTARRSLPLNTLPIIRSYAANAKYTTHIALRFTPIVYNDPCKVSLTGWFGKATDEGSTFGRIC